MRNNSNSTNNNWKYGFYLVGGIGLLILAIIMRPFTIVIGGNGSVPLININPSDLASRQNK